MPNAKPKTIAEIVARLRKAGLGNLKGDLDWTSEEVGRLLIELADEIEAAQNREKIGEGNQ